MSSCAPGIHSQNLDFTEILADLLKKRSIQKANQFSHNFAQTASKIERNCDKQNSAKICVLLYYYV